MLTHACIVCGNFFDRSRDVLDHRPVSWGVVRSDKVVINGLRDTDDTKCVTALLSELGNLVRGVLRVVATSVEKVANIVRFEDFEHAFKVGLLLELVAASTKSGTWCMAKATDILLRLSGEVNKLLVKNTEHAIEAAIDFFDALVIERFSNGTGKAGVDHGCGTAGLGDETVSFEFFRHNLFNLLDVKIRVCKCVYEGVF